MKTSTTAALALAGLTLLSSTARAGWHTSGPWSTSDQDGSTWEVYGDAINDFSGTGLSNLSNCVPGVLAWAGRMRNAGYSYQVGTDQDAWSSDFEEVNFDDSYADASDYAYVSTHGASNFVFFNGAHGDDGLTANETFWGELDMDVIAFDACNVLDANGRQQYINNAINDGVHYLLGFDSLALDTSSTADLYAYYLTQGYTHRAAWFTATTTSHPAGYVASYVRFRSGGCDTYNDTMNVVSCDPKSGSWAMTSTWAL